MSGHPDLFAGFNTAPNNGDEVDGPGLAMFPPGENAGMGSSPNWFSSLTTFEVLILTEELMSIFDSGCADLVIRGDPNTVVFPPEVETLVIREKAA